MRLGGPGRQNIVARSHKFISPDCVVVYHVVCIHAPANMYIPRHHTTHLAVLFLGTSLDSVCDVERGTEV